MKLTAVIPMYNEARVIADSLIRMDDALKDLAGEGGYEILAVSDGSTDGCDRIAQEIAEERPAVRVIAYSPNRGKGYAVRTGMLESRGDFVFFTDSDLAYGTDIVRDLLEAFGSGEADLVIASRAVKGGGYDGYTFLRKFMSKAYLKVISVAAGFSHSDSQAGLKGFSGEAAHRIFPLCEVDRFAFDLETLMIADRFGFRVKEVPARVLVHGASKVSPVRDALNMLSEVRKMKKRIRKLDITPVR